MIEVASSFALPIGYPSFAMSPDPSPSLPQLFLTFLRLGLTAFGGPSMVAYIRKVTVEQKRWLDATTFSAGVALCQMLPGATAMPVAAYSGLQLRGVWGAAASFVGFGLPAFLLMTLLAALYTSMHNLPVVLAVTDLLGQKAIVSSASSFTRVLGETYSLVDRFGWLVGLAGLLVAVAALLRAMLANLWERRRDVGVMRAVGWRRRDIGIGYLPAPAASLNEALPGLAVAATRAAETHLPVQVAPGTLLVALVVATSGGALAGWLSARRAAGLKPSEALRQA